MTQPVVGVATTTPPMGRVKITQPDEFDECDLHTNFKYNPKNSLIDELNFEFAHRRGGHNDNNNRPNINKRNHNNIPP